MPAVVIAGTPEGSEGDLSWQDAKDSKKQEISSMATENFMIDFITIMCAFR